MAGAADQMEVPRVAERRLEARTPFAEVHLAGDARVDHPLQRAIDAGAADAGVFAVHQIAEIVRAQVAFLPEEDAQDAAAFAVALAAARTESAELGRVMVHRVNSRVGDMVN